MSNLAKLTKSQLIADNPGLGLKMTMTKDAIITKIEDSAPKAKSSKRKVNGEY
jgi:hypothetical protein